MGTKYYVYEWNKSFMILKQSLNKNSKKNVWSEINCTLSAQHPTVRGAFWYSTFYCCLETEHTHIKIFKIVTR